MICLLAVQLPSTRRWVLHCLQDFCMGRFVVVFADLQPPGLSRPQAVTGRLLILSPQPGQSSENRQPDCGNCSSILWLLTC